MNTIEQATRGSLACRKVPPDTLLPLYETPECRLTKDMKFIRDGEIAIVVMTSYTPQDWNYNSYRILYVITCQGIGWIKSEYLKSL
jgi:hypothetical protein